MRASGQVAPLACPAAIALARAASALAAAAAVGGACVLLACGATPAGRADAPPVHALTVTQQAVAAQR